MASYKVPQDVEADDKLIGPFSFRQFIYLIIVALSMAGMYGLGRLFLPLAIIPLPIVIFFGAIALPLRKDQPMEVYMAAMLSFYLKPRKKMWDPDGIDSLIEITAPKIVEVQLTKDLSQTEARKRLSYLADVIDSRGWAVRGNDIQIPSSPLTTDVYYEAQDTNDILDNYSSTSQTLDYKLSQSDAKRHQDMINIVNHRPTTATLPTQQIPVAIPNNYIEQPIEQPHREPDPIIAYNPYPNIQQSVLEPIQYGQIPSTPPVYQDQNTFQEPRATTTSVIQPTTDIIDLANNTNLSVATIAKEANRINKKHEMDQEVLISLR